MKLKGKTAIITGGASGFGRASAIKFVQEGAINLLLVDLDVPGLEETKRLLLEINPDVNVILTKADVSKDEDVKAYTEEATTNFNALDIVFNNAGIEGVSMPIDEMPFEEFSKTLSIDLNSVFLGLKYALGYMKDHGGGSIINTASIGGLVALPTSVGYVASKHAIIGMTRNAAGEYGKYNIRTNAVCPGFVMTELHRRIVVRASEKRDISMDEVVEINSAKTPMGRYGEADEIADLVAFLASDEAKYITGQAIAIDGGYVAL